MMFAGSPAPAVPVLDALLASRHEVALAITREDRPRGRSRSPVATPVGDVPWVVGPGGIVTHDLADGLRHLADPERRTELGTAAAAHVRERFPASGVAASLRALYQRL